MSAAFWQHKNPGGIDSIRAISNCATWIVGKLQTKRDRDKVRGGLTDSGISPSDLARSSHVPKTGDFMLLNKEGDVPFSSMNLAADLSLHDESGAASPL